VTQENVELRNKSVKWIVPLPEKEGGTFGRPSLCAACRGNEDIGVVLNYFTFEASVEVKNRKIDISTVEYIILKRMLDDILDGVKPSRISKKTLIDYIRKLQEWGFIRANGYHHTYEVYFHKITEAIQNPPPPEKRKPRGRHVSKLQSQKLNLQSDTVKTTISTELEVKSTIQGDEVVLKLQSQIVTLQSQIVNLQSEMFTLQSQIVTLQSVQSSEVAPQGDLDGKNDALRLIRDCNRLLENIRDNVVTRRNVFSLLTEDDYRTIDDLMSFNIVANATPSPLIENLYQSLDDTSPHYPPDLSKGSASPTPAQEPGFLQSSTSPEKTESHFLDNTLQSVTVREKQGSAECTVPVTHSENEPSENALHSQETLPSVQALDESNRQATKQGESDVRTGDTGSSNSGLVEGDQVHRSQTPGSQSGVMVSPGNNPVTSSGAGESVRPQSVKQTSSDSPIAGVTTNNPATQKSRGGKGRGKKTDTPAAETPKITPVLTEEEKAYKERCAGIYNQIVKRRGHEFNTGDEVKAERTIIRDQLAKSFNDAQVDRIHRYLAEEDKYWKLPENRIRISGPIIWRESNKVSTLLKERREDEEKRKGSSGTGATLTPFQQHNRAMREKYLGKSIAQ